MKDTIQSAVEQIVHQPSKIFRGFLGEPYDGIGQFVLVTLSKSSSSAAIKARVAAGDFGGGRKFPEGTPVPVISIRGQLTVLLGNLRICGITDTFNRIFSPGWGTSDSGYIWSTSISSGNTMGVDGSKAYNVLQSLTGPDEAVITWNKSSSTDKILLSGIIFSPGSDSYYGYSLSFGFDYTAYSVVFGTDGSGGKYWYMEDGGSGSGNLTPPIDITNPFNLRVLASPTEFKVKLWAVGTSEPTDWTWISSSPNASYQTGALRYRARNFDFGVLTTGWDSLDITGVNRCTYTL